MHLRFQPRLVGLVAVFVGFAIFVSGCGNSTATIKGKVTFNGKDVDQGAIQFVPVDGKSPTAGGEIKAGQYSVPVSPGTMKVSLSMPIVKGQKKVYNTPNSPVMPITVEGLPAKYNEKSDLTVEIKPGANTKDFELSGN